MFSWDARKALKNYEKHGVSFKTPLPSLVTPKPSTGRI